VFIAIPRTLGRRPRFLFRPALPRFRCPWYLLRKTNERTKSEVSENETISTRLSSLSFSLKAVKTHLEVCPIVQQAKLETLLISPLCNLICVIFNPSNPIF